MDSSDGVGKVSNEAARDRWRGVRGKLKQIGVLENPRRPNGEMSKILDQAYWPEFFDVQHKATVGNGNVKYLNESQRSKYQVKFSEDKIAVKATQIFYVQFTAQYKGEIIFAVDCLMNFYVGIKDITSKNRFHHSSFLAGRPVAGAGTMIIGENFTILEVNNHSGHYKPGLGELKDIAKAIAANGGDLAKIKFKLFAGASMPRIFANGNDVLAA